MIQFGRQKLSPIIVLMMVVYAATFLLHDLAYSPLEGLNGPQVCQDSRYTAQKESHHSGGDHASDPIQEHHCPFCSGFTGSVTVCPLPPPVEDNRGATMPTFQEYSGRFVCTSFARAPPLA